MERFAHLDFASLLDLLATYTEEYTRAFKERKSKHEMETLHEIINDLLEEIADRKKKGAI